MAEQFLDEAVRCRRRHPRLAPRESLRASSSRSQSTLATRADQAGVRLGVVGGSGSLQVASDGPNLYQTPNAPAALVPEGRTMDTILQQRWRGGSRRGRCGSGDRQP
jgi:putative NADH-flavin reductase